MATFTPGHRSRSSCAICSALLRVRFTRKSSETSSAPSLSAAVRPAPPAPSNRTFAPFKSRRSSSRNARVIASASVLNPCERTSRGGSVNSLNGRQRPFTSLASKRTVLTAPHVRAESSNKSTISTASSLCGTVRLTPINLIAFAPSSAPFRSSGWTSNAR